MCKRVFLATGLVSFFCAMVCSYASLTVTALLAGVSVLCAVVCMVFHRVTVCRTILLAALSVFIVSTAWTLTLCFRVDPLLAYDGCEAQVTVRVRQIQSNGECLIVRTEDGELAKGIDLCLWPGDVGTEVQAGDLLSGRVQIVSSFTKDDRADSKQDKASGVWLYAWPDEDCVMIWKDGTSTLPLHLRVLYSLRDGIHTLLYRYLPEDSAALCEGMLIGERDNIAQEKLESFRDSGIYHILAVSGLHLTVIAGAVLWVTKRCHLPRRMRAIITMAVTVLFMALCGFTESIVRAGIMTLLTLSSFLFRRRADGLNSLGLAATLMLIVDPFCIYSAGWQLSFAATLGLLALFPVWEQEITARAVGAFPTRMSHVVRWTTSSVGTALCASVMTCPISAMCFGEYSLYFLVGNLIGVPLSTVLLVVGIVGVLTGGWFPLLAKAIFFIADRLCDWLYGMTDCIASWPWATISLDHPMVAVWMFLLIGAVVLGYRLYRMHGVVRMTALMLCVLCVGCSVQALVLRNTVTVTAVSSDRLAVIVENDDSRGVIFAGGEEDLFVLEKALCDRGITRLEWALWVRNAISASCPCEEFSVPIGLLLLTQQQQTYSTLPLAEQTVMVQDDTTLTFSEKGTLKKTQGTYCLLLGETTVLIGNSGSDLTALSADERQAPLVFFDEVLPERLEVLCPDSTVVFCRISGMDTLRRSLPQSLGKIYYSATDGETVWISRQKGDIALRAY